MITIKSFVFNELEVNAFVLYDETRECIIVDPGCNTPEQCSRLNSFITGQLLKPVFIVNTHGHFDHIFGNAWAKDIYKCPLLIHKDDLPLLEQAGQYAGIFGFTVDKSPLPDRFLNPGETLGFGNAFLEILHVPGHSPGSIVLYSDPDKFLICGDVLFNGGIGRTDLFGGDYNLLIEGIRRKLMVLPRETVVWPGHGPKTTIGHEYDTNPFLR
jgi:hydroxyacylglutathione hydrolase